MLENFVAGLLAALIAVAVIAGLGALFALPVMWLWNGVTPNLFAAGTVKPIDFWNAWGLLILSGLLFKGTSSSSSSN